MPKASKKERQVKKEMKAKKAEKEEKVAKTEKVEKVEKPSKKAAKAKAKKEVKEIEAPKAVEQKVEPVQDEAKKAKLKKAVEKDPESVDVKKPKGDSKRSKRFRKIEKITAEHRLNRGVVYLGHIPYGFREEEIKDFFTQFGNVTRVKLARSKKTARPKGYAFVEFDDLETAAIAADTMDKRFMFDRQLVCHVVDDEKVHKDMFKNSERKWKFIPYQKINTKNVNSEKTDEKKYLKVKRLLEQEKEKRERIQDFFNSIGKKNTYDFPGYQAVVDAAMQQAEQAGEL